MIYVDTSVALAHLLESTSVRPADLSDLIAGMRQDLTKTRYASFDELWLLALSGTLVLALDVWILLEGVRMLLAGRHALKTSEA